VSTPFISSYVLEKWNVSTIHRESSVMISSPPWYYETIVWEWDKEARRRGKMLYQFDHGNSPECASRKHAECCGQLVTTGAIKEDE
jgi:hypothetical protein